MSTARPWLAEVQKDAHARARRNQEEALDFLYTWRFSTFDVLKLNAGIKAERGGQFIRRMLENKLIAEVFVPTLKSKALTLTGAGLSLASAAVMAESRRHSSYLRIPATQARHTMYVQRAAIARKAIADEIVPEMPLALDPESDDLEEARKVPDFQYRVGDTWHAVEVELMRKSVPKIFVAYESYAVALNKGLLGSVEYVFNNKTVYALYVSLFEREEWQLFRWDDSEKRYKQIKTSPVAKRIRDKFSFKLEEHPYD